MGVYLKQLLGGTLYPVDGVGILIYEREHGLRGDDPLEPYVPHGCSIEHRFINEEEAIRDEVLREGTGALASVLSDEIFNECDGEDEKLVGLGNQTYSARAMEAQTGINLLVWSKSRCSRPSGRSSGRSTTTTGIH